MAKFEYEFSQEDRELVVSEDSGYFGGTNYIRLTIYPTEAIDNIVTLEDETKGVNGQAIFFSSLNEQPFEINISPFGAGLDEIKTQTIGGDSNDFKIYRDVGSDGEPMDTNLYIKPNDIFDEFGLPDGNYKIQVDFLNQSSINLITDLNVFKNPTMDDGPEDTSEEYLATLPFPRFFEEFDLPYPNGDIGEGDRGAFLNELLRPDIRDYINDLLDGLIPEPPHHNRHYQFVIKEISTSRKEVRLKLLNEDIRNNSFTINELTKEFNDNGDSYAFKHLLNIGTGDHIPIMNYTFDKVTDGSNNQSIILKLYDPIPINITAIKHVTIEKEVLITQAENVRYFSDVPDIFFGDGLIPDPQENWLNPDGNEPQFESYNELTSSLDDITIDNLISGSYDYPNLNTDFRFFENHTHFGSAKRKLENFKNKVETIQEYYSEISSSLNVSCSIENDGTYVIQQRQDLFKKINDEIKSFTPYERFLYYDGQNESTASAPGLGKNYADTIPVNTKHGQPEYMGEIDGGDGFNVVYHHSSEIQGGSLSSKYIDLFTSKYFVQNKPFFNYSSSIYLSFLMKGDSGSSVLHGNGNYFSSKTSNGEQIRFPIDAFHKTELQTPHMTGSAYQRYVYQVSQSYWQPNKNVEVEDYGILSGSDFSSNSPFITILSGSVKTGSKMVKDTSGKYQNYTTVTSASNGVKFSGSCMPAGELFRIYYINNLSSSLEGYYNYENITIDDNDFEVPDVSGNGRTLKWSGEGASYTSASLKDGADGTPNSALGWTGSLSGSSGLMSLTTTANQDIGLMFTGSFTGFTMATWVKTTGGQAPDNGFTIMAIDIKASGSIVRNNSVTSSTAPSGSGNDCDGWHISFDGDELFGSVTDQGYPLIETSDLDATVDVDDGEWHHVALTYNKTTGTSSLYFDGGNVATEAATGAPLMTGSNEITDFIIGTGAGGAHGYGDMDVDESRFYTRELSADEINLLYLHPDAQTDTKITDVKISFNNPTDVLPFDNIYHTSSTNWTDWYNGMYDSASAFDSSNIHSLENNLPLYIQNSNDYDDFKDFLSLQGEQYDLIRNHIDSMGTLHDRGYKKTDSPPNNALPILLDNMGWQAINPFSGSLTDSLGGYLSGVTSIDDIKNQTWRKTLNNLLYIYKSKGTKNSVRGLLNVYGYPPDVLEFQEFGGTTDEIIQNSPGYIKNTIPTTGVDTDLNRISGSIGFIQKKQKLHRYMFGGSGSLNQDRMLNLDWWMDDANINCFEFVYKHVDTAATQTILKSSGSGAENLWDLRLIPSSDRLSSSFEFRLNNSQVADTAISNRGFSMSLDYTNITDGQLWNVMVQRMTGSTSGRGTIEYQLHAALQDGKKIQTYNFTSMSISGGLSGGSGSSGLGFFANENWQSSGSRGVTTASNLFVGETTSGSIAEIKAWDSALSFSRFRQHTLNKFSTAGNTINAHRTNLFYHFKLNENYSSASVSASGQNLNIVDSAPKTTYSDYSFEKTGNIFVGSTVYGFDIIDVIRFSVKDNTIKENDNNILINPTKNIVGNLNPFQSSIKTITDKNSKPLFNTSPKLELYRSPQTFVNEYILDNTDAFNLENYYGNPFYYNSSSYEAFDTLRKEFFDSHPIEVDSNKFIRAHEDMFNHSIVEGIKSIVPARSTFSDKNSNMGVEIKPTILEKQKHEHEQHSTETNPNTATGSLSVVSVESIVSSSKLEIAKSASISIITPETIMSSSKLQEPYSASIGRGYIPDGLTSSDTSSLKPSITGSSIVSPKSASISVTLSTTGSGVDFPKSGSIDYSAHSNKSFENIHDNWGTGVNDTYFINYYDTGSDGNSNTYHIDTRFHFLTIGDTEIYSGSGYPSSSNGTKINTFDYTDFSNSDRFFNRTIVSNNIHKNTTYESLINGTVGGQTGRMMGKTRYFITSSDGTITLPRNHITNYSYPFKERMNGGTQNTNPGFLTVRYEDYSSASFYRVTVTGGENEIVVKSGDPSLDDEDKIIY